MSEPKWIEIARKYIGTREIKGKKHNSIILRWWQMIKRGGIKDDETPWCAAFVGGVLEEAGLVSSRFESAKSYLSWGTNLIAPVAGCVVVFDRDGGGHVGFVVGRDKAGFLLVLGGNQGDAVNIKAFPLSRVAKNGFRWPSSVPVPKASLPILAAASISKNEA